LVLLFLWYYWILTAEIASKFSGKCILKWGYR
jgi:hypothetical protein